MSLTTRAGVGLASVIVPCCHPREFTRLCITALLRHTRRPWELIVVDNGSTDGAAYLQGVRDAVALPVVVVADAGALDLPAAYRRGLRAARGTYVVLLAPDVIVTDAWLDQLVALVESDPGLGLVGPMSNAAGGPQRVEAVPYDDGEGLRRFADRWRAEHRGQWSTVGARSGPCLLLTRAALERAGGWDEAVGAVSLEDLARRVHRAGYRQAVAHDLYVHGFGGRGLVGSDEDRARFVSRWSPGGVPAHAGSRRRTVSLTMIVRDEEANLPACLGSAAGLFDEIVVVDTGSADRTREIARSFGARVFDFVWVDDFAAARNAALARARGDYAFWLDADDRIERPERAKLRALFDSLGDADADAAYVVRCACDPEPGGGGAAVVDHVRLFPVREEVRWSYRVHEQILPALRAAGVAVRWTDATIRHTGYADPRLRGRKLDRDTAILHAELAERPDDPFVLFNLGAIAVERGAWRPALDYLRASLAGSAPTDSITRKLYALIARSHQMLGEPGVALAACAAGLEADPDDAELLFRMAVLHRQAGDAAPAEALWRRILELRRPERFSSVDDGIYGHLTRRNLAALAEARGDVTEAAGHWVAVQAECPGDPEAALALARLGRSAASSSGPAPGERAS